MASLSQISISNNQFSSPLVVRSSNNSIVSQTISLRLPTIFGSELKSGEIEQTHLRLLSTFKKSPRFTVKASTKSAAMTQELENSKIQRVAERESGFDYFEIMKLRFLSFKKHKYMENLEHYQSLAKGQAPKFMVIACADSRVCPSAILGFQPGEAFTVRNVANLVPPFESGPSETKAALEFAVNSLKVENILVIGHSCCGGIRALMSMEDEGDSSSFIKNWVVVGENARLSTKTIASNLNFDQQCQHCEKESVNHSLLNLLTYPWIEEKVKRGVLYIHGSYYDFVNCTFEKWTLDHQENRSKETKRFSIKDRLVWG